MNGFFLDVGNSSTVLAAASSLEKINITPTEKVLENPSCLGLKRDAKISLASVVEQVNHKLKQHYHNMHIITYHEVPIPTINLPNPNEIGIDRLLTATAAWRRYQQAVLVLDAGTALTCCLVDSSGVYQGGLIFPGIGTCSKALNDQTDKIPYIHIKAQQHLLGKSTQEAVEIGLYRGFKHVINGLIADYKAVYAGIKVLGTGKSLEIFQDEIALDAYHENLIFEGMKATLSQ
eukprot:COSAG01_NODE_775_length_13698_cov_60.191632_14_plen_233_part_00